MLSNPQCKCKALTVYIRPFEGSLEYATLQAMTGHPGLSIKPAQSPPVPVFSANPTRSGNAISSEGNADKASHWDDLCYEYSNLLEAPGFLVERQIKHCINLLNPNLPVNHHEQYHILLTKLEEVHSQLAALLEKVWI